MTYLPEMVLAAKEGRTYTITVPHTYSFQGAAGTTTTQIEVSFTMPGKLKLRDRTAHAEAFIRGLREKHKNDPFFRFIYPDYMVLRRLLTGQSGT